MEYCPQCGAKNSEKVSKENPCQECGFLGQDLILISSDRMDIWCEEIEKEQRKRVDQV